MTGKGNFQELTEFLDGVEKAFGVPACDCILAKDGEILYRHRAGSLKNSGETGKETYWLYSATKIATCTAAMQLMERGRLGLDDPVGKYLPEFEALRVRRTDGSIYLAGRKMTVLHLMTITGGLDYDLSRPGLRAALALPERERTTQRIVRALSEDPLLFEPGTRFRYSFCHDVLGAVIEVAAGQRLCDYMREFIFAPLGMEDTTFHPNPRQRARMVKQYAHSDDRGTLTDWNQDNEWRFGDEYDSGGAGLMSTVEDYIRLLSALSLGGALPGGERILRSESVKKMATPRLEGVALEDFWNRSAAMKGYNYGLGVRVLVDGRGIASPPGEFGWDGAAGAYALVEPINHIALYYAQQVYSCPIVYQKLHPALRDTVWRCLKKETERKGIK